jgi:hypothetical protein
VIATRDYGNLRLSNFANKTMSQIYSPWPEALQLVMQRFGLTNALKWSSLDDLDQFVDLLEYALVCVLPIEVVRPGLLCE